MRDTYDGNNHWPMSYNKWLYVSANPINTADPSGNVTVEDCMKIPDTQARQICLYYAACNVDLCSPAPDVVNLWDPAHAAYNNLAHIPCVRKDGELFPWWRTWKAQQVQPAFMTQTMLVAILVYTEASPIQLAQNSGNVLAAWIKALKNRYNAICNELGGCAILDGGTRLSQGLSTFLRWSPRFRFGSGSYSSSDAAIAAIYNKIYGEPDWAYNIAVDVVKGGVYQNNLPWGACNTQSIEEERYFLRKFLKYGEESIEKDGVYYMWGSGLDEARSKKSIDQVKSIGDLVILTKAQEQHHCRSGKGEWPCGRNR